jgi:hypothetical protein
VGLYARPIGLYLDDGFRTRCHRCAVLSCRCGVAQDWRLTGSR